MVCSQFAIHYAFKSEQSVKQLLYNVSSNLKPGGLFIGTTVDEKQLAERLQRATVNAAGNTEFGNSRYKVEFLAGHVGADRVMDAKKIYSLEYNFTLYGSVENCAEYVIRWGNFVRLAKEFGLNLDYNRDQWSNFAQFYEHYSRMKEHGAAYNRMCPELDDDEWEAATIYRTFVFRKK